MDNKLQRVMQQELIEQETFVRLDSTDTTNCAVTLHIFILFQEGVKHVTEK